MYDCNGYIIYYMVIYLRWFRSVENNWYVSHKLHEVCLPNIIVSWI